MLGGRTMNAAGALPVPRAATVAGARIDVRTALALLLGLSALAAVFVLAASVGDLGWWDAWVSARFAELRGCAATRGTSRFTNAAPYVGGLLAGTSAVSAVVRGRRREGVAVCVLLALALLVVQALKLLFERHRPGLLPWVDASDESFPSGHVANAAVSVAAALRLGLPLRPGARRRLAMVLALVFVLAVAWTRVYLGRHWPTDVGAGLLLGVAFWGLTVAPTARVTVVGAALVALVVLPGLYIAVANGARIELHSPSHFEQDAPRRAALRAAERLTAGAEGTVTLIRGGPGVELPFARVIGPAAALTLGGGAPERDVLKIIARPLRGVHHGQCPRLEVVVDGARVAAPALQFRWRSYPFALPPLGPGPHHVAIRVRTKGAPLADDVPVLGVAAVALGR